MPLPLDPSCLSDGAIRDRAAAHGLTIDDERQLAFLRRTDSVDLQAAPGCGKTTLIGLKLCLLASGWQRGTSGVCVISHTNVAKDQIIEILKSDDEGRRFLSYPHFIGTIQAFADTFIALPYLRSKGIEVRSIDDDFQVKAAMAELRKPAYGTLRGLVNPPNPRGDIKALIQTAHYVWEANRLTVYGIHNGKQTAFPFRSTTASSQEFVALKDALASQGIYCYADMVAYGSQCVQQHSHIPIALQRRFPFLLIDEMQDTSMSQEYLLEAAFGHGPRVVQRIGDVNQRIYAETADDGNDAQFPRAGFIGLPRSMRFGNAIASAATPLTLTSPQQLSGHPGRTELAPILMLFDQTNVGKVIPTFGRYVLREVAAAELARYPVKAIGARKSGDADQFPKQIQCYFAQYNPTTSQGTKPEMLYHAVLGAQPNTGSGWKVAADRLWDASCELLYRWGFTLDGKHPTQGRLQYRFAQGDPANSLRVRKAILGLTKVDASIKEEWDAAASELCEAFRTSLGIDELSRPAAQFCAFPAEDIGRDSLAAERCESYVVQDGDESLHVHVSTIHAAKGETHAATLVLECFSRIHDLKEVLPIVVAKHNRRRLEDTQSIKPAVRRTFVAMTRPRNLLAVAVRKDHIAQLVPDFQAAGWRIVDLTA